MTDHSPCLYVFKTEENPDDKEKLDTIVEVNRKILLHQRIGF